MKETKRREAYRTLDNPRIKSVSAWIEIKFRNHSYSTSYSEQLLKLLETTSPKHMTSSMNH